MDNGNQIVVVNENHFLGINGAVPTRKPVLDVLDGAFWCCVAGAEVRVGENAPI